MPSATTHTFTARDERDLAPGVEETVVFEIGGAQNLSFTVANVGEEDITTFTVERCRDVEKGSDRLWENAVDLLDDGMGGSTPIASGYSGPITFPDECLAALRFKVTSTAGSKVRFAGVGR